MVVEVSWFGPRRLMRMVCHHWWTYEFTTSLQNFSCLSESSALPNRELSDTNELSKPTMNCYFLSFFYNSFKSQIQDLVPEKQPSKSTSTGHAFNLLHLASICCQICCYLSVSLLCGWIPVWQIETVDQHTSKSYRLRKRLWKRRKPGFFHLIFRGILVLLGNEMILIDSRHFRWGLK